MPPGPGTLPPRIPKRRINPSRIQQRTRDATVVDNWKDHNEEILVPCLPPGSTESQAAILHISMSEPVLNIPLEDPQKFLYKLQFGVNGPVITTPGPISVPLCGTIDKLKFYFQTFKVISFVVCDVVGREFGEAYIGVEGLFTPESPNRPGGLYSLVSEGEVVGKINVILTLKTITGEILSGTQLPGTEAEEDLGLLENPHFSLLSNQQQKQQSGVMSHLQPLEAPESVFYNGSSINWNKPSSLTKANQKHAKLLDIAQKAEDLVRRMANTEQEIGKEISGEINYDTTDQHTEQTKDTLNTQQGKPRELTKKGNNLGQIDVDTRLRHIEKELELGKRKQRTSNRYNGNDHTYDEDNDREGDDSRKRSLSLPSFQKYLEPPGKTMVVLYHLHNITVSERYAKELEPQGLGLSLTFRSAWNRELVEPSFVFVETRSNAQLGSSAGQKQHMKIGSRLRRFVLNKIITVAYRGENNRNVEGENQPGIKAIAEIRHFPLSENGDVGERKILGLVKFPYIPVNPINIQNSGLISLCEKYFEISPLNNEVALAIGSRSIVDPFQTKSPPLLFCSIFLADTRSAYTYTMEQKSRAETELRQLMESEENLLDTVHKDQPSAETPGENNDQKLDLNDPVVVAEVINNKRSLSCGGYPAKKPLSRAEKKGGKNGEKIYEREEPTPSIGDMLPKSPPPLPHTNDGQMNDAPNPTDTPTSIDIPKPVQYTPESVDIDVNRLYRKKTNGTRYEKQSISISPNESIDPLPKENDNISYEYDEYSYDDDSINNNEGKNDENNGENMNEIVYDDRDVAAKENTNTSEQSKSYTPSYMSPLTTPLAVFNANPTIQNRPPNSVEFSVSIGQGVGIYLPDKGLPNSYCVFTLKPSIKLIKSLCQSLNFQNKNMELGDLYNLESCVKNEENLHLPTSFTVARSSKCVRSSFSPPYTLNTHYKIEDSQEAQEIGNYNFKDSQTYLKNGRALIAILHWTGEKTNPIALGYSILKIKDLLKPSTVAVKNGDELVFGHRVQLKGCEEGYVEITVSVKLGQKRAPHIPRSRLIVSIEELHNVATAWGSNDIKSVVLRCSYGMQVQETKTIRLDLNGKASDIHPLVVLSFIVECENNKELKQVLKTQKIIIDILANQLKGRATIPLEPFLLAPGLPGWYGFNTNGDNGLTGQVKLSITPDPPLIDGESVSGLSNHPPTIVPSASFSTTHNLYQAPSLNPPLPYNTGGKDNYLDFSSDKEILSVIRAAGEQASSAKSRLLAELGNERGRISESRKERQQTKPDIQPTFIPQTRPVQDSNKKVSVPESTLDTLRLAERIFGRSLDEDSDLSGSD